MIVFRSPFQEAFLRIGIINNLSLLVISLLAIALILNTGKRKAREGSLINTKIIDFTFSSCFSRFYFATLSWHKLF